jgi:hypothetical protein
MSQNNGETKLQYWRNGIMMGLVDVKLATEIMQMAKGVGKKVYYTEGQQHFSVENDPKNEQHFINLD